MFLDLFFKERERERERDHCNTQERLNMYFLLNENSPRIFQGKCN